MIIQFTIGNFLSFKEKHTISFRAKAADNTLPDSTFTTNKEKLLRTIAIYGANASGKSNLIKAFGFVRQFVLTGLVQSVSSSQIAVEPFLLNTLTESQPSYFELEIMNGKKTFVYGFEVSSQRVLKEWLYEYPNKKVLFERTPERIKTNPKHFKEGSAYTIKETRDNVLYLSVVASRNGLISQEVVDCIKKIQVVIGLQRGQTLNYSFEKYTKDESYRNQMKDFLLEADFGISDIMTEEKQVTADEFMKTVPPQFKDTLSPSPSPKNFFDRKIGMIHDKYNDRGEGAGQVIFNFFKESDGTQQMFALSAPFINSLQEANLLVIDELDSSLHPILCQYILKIFNSSKKNNKNAQLLFTTHDVSLLDEELLRRDQVLFTQKNKFGSSELFSLADLGERANLNFAKRYLEGRYGALPYVKLLENME